MQIPLPRSLLFFFLEETSESYVVFRIWLTGLMRLRGRTGGRKGVDRMQEREAGPRQTGVRPSAGDGPGLKGSQGAEYPRGFTVGTDLTRSSCIMDTRLALRLTSESWPAARVWCRWRGSRRSFCDVGSLAEMNKQKKPPGTFARQQSMISLRLCTNRMLLPMRSCPWASAPSVVAVGVSCPATAWLGNESSGQSAGAKRGAAPAGAHFPSSAPPNLQHRRAWPGYPKASGGLATQPRQYRRYVHQNSSPQLRSALARLARHASTSPVYTTAAASTTGRRRTLRSEVGHCTCAASSRQAC